MNKIEIEKALVVNWKIGCQRILNGWLIWFLGPLSYDLVQDDCEHIRLTR